MKKSGAKIANPWSIKFKNTLGYAPKTVAIAEKIMAAGFTMENKAKGVGATYDELKSNGFKWAQMMIAYKKSMVSIPFFVGDYGKIYILLSHNYQPVAEAYFDESARGFAAVKDDRLETTMETAIRIIEQKTNLPTEINNVFRLAKPINPDPSWFNIPKGLSYVGCKFQSSLFQKMDNDEYIVNKKFVLNPNKPVPKIMLLDEYLERFDSNIESNEDPICGLTLGAAALLWRYLETHCDKCHENGHRSIGGNIYLCNCGHGQQLLKRINQDMAECPSCHNTGVHYDQDNYTLSQTASYCTCKHGFELMLKTALHPESCPVCHGKQKYDPINDVDNFGDNTQDCICAKIFNN
ncbi:MAG: hypothetical protein WDA13_02985 [Candidatus Shapirobacteria bacterium]